MILEESAVPLPLLILQRSGRFADALRMSLEMNQLLQGMVKWDASDLHLKVGSPPGVRLHGHIQPIQNLEPLKPANTIELMKQVLNEEQIAEFEKTGDLDCAYSIPGLARFRVNVMKQRGSVSMVLRKIPVAIPDIDQLKLPAICKELAMKPRGLVLVTGPTGSGKSTTLAAMIDYRNKNERGHILTMEDPVEFVHVDKLSYVNQREIGSDTKTFASALKRALRQDPDVILVGEMRDLETISMGLTAAETGHLVFGTLHTTGAAQTVDRIVDVFPPDQQEQVRVQLASTLQGVVSQVLLPKIGGGRVAAHEIMIAVDAIRACIREGKVSQMALQMQTGAKSGMIQLDTALGKLVQEGVVELKDALAKATSPDLVKRFAGSRAGVPVEAV
jgi:twitching motility protein PilT